MSESTIIWQSFNEYFGDRIVGEIKPIDLENFQMRQKKKGLSDGYIDQQVQVAKTMCNRAFHNDMISGDVIKFLAVLSGF